MNKAGISLFLLMVSFFLSTAVQRCEGQINRVLAIKVNGVINPVANEFIAGSIKKAGDMHAEALVIELDTPGGLDTSMRGIVKYITGSDVPIITYVYPSGARAASAGVFIAFASHISAMAPGTNIGAAHPVSVGDKMDRTMSEKATNDAAAYLRALAQRSGRNSGWAEDAVRKSVSATEEEAVSDHIVDIVSRNMDSLLRDIDGRIVATVSGKKTLHTKGASVIREEMGLRHKVLNVISDPSVAYMLMLLGFYGLFFELTNPGTLFPGVAGAFFLVLALYSFQTLPVNYAGLLLIILALALFILEIKIVSHGLLTVGGIISMLTGSLMLFDSPDPFLRLSFSIIIPAVIVTALFFSATFGLAYKALRRKPVTGIEGLTGMEGTALSDITGSEGTVTVRGEIWSAYSDEHIIKGEVVTIISVSGLKIKVKKRR